MEVEHKPYHELTINTVYFTFAHKLWGLYFVYFGKKKILFHSMTAQYIDVIRDICCSPDVKILHLSHIFLHFFVVY